MPRAVSILVSAGEVSGDRIAAAVVRELLRRHPRWRFFGAGGEALVAAGVEVRHAASQLAAVGLVEALPRVGSAARLLLDLGLQSWIRRPQLALLVDCPGINLPLAALLRRVARTPVLYYVAPQRWAWLEGRTPSLRQVIDRLAVTLPFEERWFAERGVAATFVGHPLLDLFQPTPRGAARAALGLGSGPVLALLPGSRSDEIRRHLPLLLQALALLPREVQPALATLPGASARICAARAPTVPRGASETVLGAADAALCASGTATLEAAIAGVPTAAFYRLSTLSYAAARRLVRVPHVALPNLILGWGGAAVKTLPDDGGAPADSLRRGGAAAGTLPDNWALRELIQDEMTPDALAAEARRLLDAGEAARQRAALAQVVACLGPPGAASRVADLAEELVDGRARRR